MEIKSGETLYWIRPRLLKLNFFQHPFFNMFPWSSIEMSMILQVAEFALQGVEKGYFFARSPDILSNLAISSCSGVAPKLFHPILEFFLLPVYYLIHVWVRRGIDKRIIRWRRETSVKPGELSIGAKELHFQSSISDIQPLHGLLFNQK